MSLFDKFMKPIKEVRKRLAERKKTKQEEKQNQELLEKWKTQFETDRQAKSSIDADINEKEQYYQGSREFKNLRDAGQNQAREVRTVVNFIRMVIEALIDLSVPQPDLAPVSLDDEYAVKLLNKYVTYVCKSADLEEINLSNERRTRKYGGTFYKVHWDNSVKYGMYVGDIKISDPHPRHIVNNAGSINWSDDLEHYHHIVNKTEKYVLRRWSNLTKEMLEDNAVLYEEYDQMPDGTGQIVVDGTVTNSSSTKESGLKRWSIIETTYRDDDGDICKLWWSGDLLIDHVEKFYWHRNEEGVPVDSETIEVGTPIRVGIDENKHPIFKPIEEVSLDPDTHVRDEMGNLIGIKVDYYIPKSWDIIYQPYMPKDLSCWATSMIDDIQDLYESALKAVYIQEESFLRGRKKIITDNEEDARSIMDPGTEVIKLIGNVKEVDINTNIDGMGWINWLWGMIQLMTGATNAAMGVHDAGVKSGRQAQLYVSQANFKANLASAYKAIAYRKLYRTVADFAMAFCDDDRPFRLDGDNKSEYGTFSRLALLRDHSGNIVYPNWDINISCEAGFMQNKTEVLNAIIQLASQKAFEPTPGNVAYLKVLQKLGMPHLESIIAYLEDELKKLQDMAKEQQQMAMQQQAQQQNNGGGQGQGQPQGAINPEELIAQLPPEQQQMFMQLMQENPQMAQQILQQAMGGGAA